MTECNKYGLCCGINYKNTRYELRGCIPDARAMEINLRRRGFDCSILHEAMGTRANIIREIEDMAKASYTNPESRFAITVSSHGTYHRDVNSDDLDRRDEAIVCYNGDTIKDDELRGLLNQFHPSSKVYLHIDCCHSGTICDLPYKWSRKSVYTIENNTSPLADIICVSGCTDTQTSADITVGTTSYGAFSNAWLKTDKTQSVFDLVTAINRDLNQQVTITSSRLLHSKTTLSDYL